MRVSVRLYRILLKLYPAGFREGYAAPLEREFRDELAETAGWRDVGRLWARTARDLVASVPAQVVREARQDCRHALRLWARRPLTTALAILTLAIGIGANTGVFSVINTLLLRSLPFREPERLASIRMFNPVGLNGGPAEFRDWRTKSAYLQDAARYNTSEMNLGEAQTAARVRLTETSANFFETMGAAPVLGRPFDAGEDTPGRDAVAVIGYGLWQQAFGGDPRAIGATIRLNGAPLTVIGVAPPRFDYPQGTAVWSPTTFDWGRVPKTGVNFLENIGRLKAGMSWAQARQAFDAEAYARDPKRRNATEENRPALVPIRDQLAGPLKRASLILMGGVALTLLIACVNVANLMLARTLERTDELRIRGAMGASGARLTQQLLTECALLSGAAALAGMAVALWTTRVAAAMQPATLAGQTLLDWRVLGFTATAAMLTAMLFGAAPALYGRRASMMVRSPGAARANRMRGFLAAAQVALTVALLAGSIGLGRAFVKLLGVDNGFALRDVVTMSVSLAGTSHDKDGRAAAYLREALARVQSVPGVVAASATEFLPLAANAFMGGRFKMDDTGRPAEGLIVPIAPEFFRSMGGEILYGRDFDRRDTEPSEQVAIVSEELAREFGEPRDAVGRMLTPEWRSKPLRIVGVARGLRFSGPLYRAGGQVFQPSVRPTFLTVTAKVRGEARAAIPAVRDALRSVDPKVPVFNAETMEERLDETLARPRFYATAMLFFGGFAALLAVVGVYGVVSYAVSQQRREMGIRLALGATPRQLRGSAVARLMAVAAAGAAPGILGAMATRRYVASLIAGADAAAGWQTAAAAAAILAIAAAAAWMATRRIGRLDITAIVRAD